jgi:hypothetical protein
VLIKQIEDKLIICVLKVFQIITKTFLYEFFFFWFKGICNIELLQLFICKIDTKLLKGIQFEILEPENIQESNSFISTTFNYGFVQFFNKPRKEFIV